MSLDGIPRSIIAAGKRRAVMSAFTPGFADTLNQQTQIREIEDRIQNVEDISTQFFALRTAQGYAPKPTLANGDCSQWSFGPKVDMRCLGDSWQAHSISLLPPSWRVQQRAVPIMDRWYHLADLSGLLLGRYSGDVNQDFQVLAEQYDLRAEREANAGNPPVPQPSVANSALKLTYKGKWAKTLATDNFGMLAIYHRIPDVRRWENTTVTFSFWCKVNTPTQLYYQLARQYNATKPNLQTYDASLDPNHYLSSEWGLRNSAPPGIEVLQRAAFGVKTSLGWQRFDFTVNLPALDTTKTIDDTYNEHGLVVMVGPMFHTPWHDGAGFYNHETWGDLDTANGGAGAMDTSSYPDGLQVYLTEFQLVESPTPTSFVQQNEVANCQPYIAAIRSLYANGGANPPMLAQGIATRSNYFNLFPQNQSSNYDFHPITACAAALSQYGSDPINNVLNSGVGVFNCTDNFFQMRFPRQFASPPDCLTIVDLKKQKVLTHLNNFNIVQTGQKNCYFCYVEDNTPAHRQNHWLDFSGIQIEQIYTKVGASGSMDAVIGRSTTYTGTGNVGPGFAGVTSDQDVFHIEFPQQMATYDSAFFSIVTPPYSASPYVDPRIIIHRYTNTNPGDSYVGMVISSRTKLQNHSNDNQLAFIFHKNECDPGSNSDLDLSYNKVTPPPTGEDVSQSIWTICIPQAWHYTDSILKH